jgi:hypothetical protein
MCVKARVAFARGTVSPARPASIANRDPRAPAKDVFAGDGADARSIV